ncbi:hypothetical protein NHX12_011875 [Muraenolepis orangiensis]|uniref:Uncharacterized protein n=1 Tax=Muraenolepis orangiensis TaxID=630683 RepID=A0A9Q0I645_9TELE|nr:hypothetical protein NHX12_011875 [Muraenolepis orangiensis]
MSEEVQSCKCIPFRTCLKSFAPPLEEEPGRSLAMITARTAAWRERRAGLPPVECRGAAYIGPSKRVLLISIVVFQ